MLTFKDFLIENNVIRKWSLTPLNRNDFPDLIKKYASQSLNEFKKGHALYRGFEKGLKSDFSMINTTTSHRASRDSNNLYQIMMDASTALSDYPSRSNSLICATELGIAESYADASIILPFDNTPICYSHDVDFYSHEIKFIDDLPLIHINGRLSEFLKFCGINPGNGIGASEIDSKLNGFTPEFLIVAMSEYVEFIKLNLPRSENMDENVKEKYVKQHKPQHHLTRDVLEMLRYSTHRFTDLSSILFTPKTLGLILANSIKEKWVPDSECWFSGNCFVLKNKEKNEQLLKEL